MTTQTNLQVRNTGRGRPTSDSIARARNAVIRLIENSEGPITTKEIAKATKLKRHNVLLAVRWLEVHGVVTRTGETRKVKGRGRPTVQWVAVK